MNGSTISALAIFAALSLAGSSAQSQSGTLTVYKTFEPASLLTGLPPGASFAVKVVCTPGVTTMLQLSSTNQFKQTLPAVAAGTSCAIAEMTPVNAPPPRDCRWAKAAFPKGQSLTIPTGDVSLVVQNAVVCQDPKATDVRIVKVGGGNISLGSTATFNLRPANLGPGSIGTGNITIVDTLPSMFGAPIVASGVPGWSCGVVGRIVTCTWTGGTLGPQMSMTQIVVAAVATSVGVAQNCGWAKLNGVTELQSANNVSCVGVSVNAPKPQPTLTVNKILVPATDPAKFTLRIDGINRAFAVGNGGTTGAIFLTAGTHAVSELTVAGPGVHSNNYSAVIGGDCTAAGTVALADGDNKVCTITNTRRAQLKVVKTFVPANATGMFTLLIDGQTVGGAFGPGVNVGHNGTTGFVTLNAGQHYVSEGGGFSGPGDQSHVANFSPNCAGGVITLQPASSAVCTITNTKSHGEWAQGPGTFSVSVCSTGGCDINGAPGQTLPLTVEVWAAGGGGAGGGFREDTHGGRGGGAGGGGGYAKVTATATVPVGAGTVNYWVRVGAGGTAGTGAQFFTQTKGGDGGFSEVRLGGATGTILLKAFGGAGGHSVGYSNVLSGGGQIPVAAAGALKIPGANGSGGAEVTGCNGGAGGTGGVGGGPGAINNGGNGGHGGYSNRGTALFGGCTAQSDNGSLTPGGVGGNGKVRISW